MPKFRRRPLEIEAEQFTGELVPGVCDPSGSSRARHTKGCIAGAHVHGRHGVIPLRFGEWVLRNTDGSFATMPHDDFREAHEEIA